MTQKEDEGKIGTYFSGETRSGLCVDSWKLGGSS